MDRARADAEATVIRKVSHALVSDSRGNRRLPGAHVWGVAAAAPTVHVQAGLHADEMPGMIVAQHLVTLLDPAERAGRIAGEIRVVPVANPIGLDQWIAHKPQGRQDLESLQNFNRGYPDLAALAGDAVAGQLTSSADANRALVRAAFGTVLADLPRATEIADLISGWR